MRPTKRKPASKSEHLLNVHEAAELLGVGIIFLYTHKEIPHLRVGRAIRYRKEEILTHFKQQGLRVQVSR